MSDQRGVAAMTAWALQPFPTGRGYRRYRQRHACYRNATLLTLDHSELRVVRGYMLGSYGTWIGHWWCVDEEGRVIDPTLRNEGIAYVGEELDIKEVARRFAESDVWESGIENHAPISLWPELCRLAGRPQDEIDRAEEAKRAGEEWLAARAGAS